MAKKRSTWALGAVTTAGLTLAAAAKDRHDKIQRVAPELRHPVLYLDLPRSRAALPMLRRLMPSSPVGSVPGVAIRGRSIPASGDAGVERTIGVQLAETPGRRRPSGALLWLHGGGYMLGTAGLDARFTSSWARELGLLVVSVDYRLAPEHPFPAALDDAFDALVWLHEHAEELGVDPGRIAVGGQSAGGGLAAALAQRAYDAGVPVAFQHLVYPMLDDRTCHRDVPGGIADFVWTPEHNRLGWASYLGRLPQAGADAESDVPPYAVPARRYALTGLPPAWIGVGTLDLFHTEDVAYAERLREAGVDVTLEVVDGMYHAADHLVTDAPQIRLFRQSQTDALRAALAPLETH